MYVSEAGRVCDDCISDEWLPQLFWQLVLDAHPLFDRLLERIYAETVSRLYAGPPCAAQNFCNTLSPLANIPTAQCVEAGHQARVLHHERHEFGWITADAEKLQSIFNDEILEGRVCRQTHSVAVCFLEHLA